MSCRSVAARLCLLACAFAITLVAPGAASADSALVTNGRFQQPALDSSYGVLGSIPGWSETTGCGLELWSHDFIVPSPFQAQVVELNSNCPSRIEQTIATTPGRRYTVTYFFGARPGTTPAENVIEPAWNGNAETSQSTADTTLRQHSFTVTGTGSDVLSFRSATYDIGVGTLLSLVSVAPADDGPQVEFSPADVNGTVGLPLTTTGKFATPSSGTLDVRASVGHVSAEPDGSFTWTSTPTAPATAAPVTITATDGDGRSATTSFTMTATPGPAVRVAGCLTRNADGTLEAYTAQVTNVSPQDVWVFTEGTPTRTGDQSSLYRYGFGHVDGSGAVAANTPFHTVPAGVHRVYVTVRPQNWPSGVILAQAIVPICGFDDTAPVETPTVSGTLGSDGWYTGDVGISWLVTDDESDVTASTGCDAQTLTTDTAGSISTCSATSDGGTSSDSVVIKRDATAPVLSVPSETVVVEAADADGAPATYAATASDATSGVAGVLCTQPSGSTFPVGDTSVSCKATDAAGNHTNASFTVRVVDTTAPSFVAPQDLTAEADGPDGAKASFDAPPTSDAVDGAGTADCAPASGTTFALGTTTVTCTATDAAGNTRSKSFDVTVGDTTAPAIDTPGDQAAEATSADGARVDYPAATASDLVDRAVATDCDHGAGDLYALGTTKVTCTATDAAGNTSTASFDVRVADTTAPAFDAPAGITAEATGPEGATVGYDRPATTDAVDGAGTAGCDPAPGSTFALDQSTEVTCTATDKAGNTRSKSFTVKVGDSTAPAVSAPADRSAEATGPDGAKVTFGDATARDRVDGDLPAHCDAGSGDTFAVGTTKVTCSATDAHGNTGTASFDVVVRDTTAPSVDVADQTVEATGPDGTAVDLGATARDVVDGALAASCDPASGSTFALGATKVTCSATDAHGNTAGATATVKVVDTTAPAFDAPADATAEATGPQGAKVSYENPRTADAVDGAGAASCAPAPGATFALGTTKVTCTATDTAGNTRSRSFDVKVQDTTAPKLGLPADIALTATSAQGAKAAYTATSADTVDGSDPVTCTPASGSQFAPGTTTVACTATDKAGNTATGTFKVAVAFAWGPGFADPLRDNALTGNAGRTVPLKFTLTGASAGITVARAVVLLGQQGKPLSQVAVNTVSAGAFHYNLSTKGLAPGVYTVRVDLGDGVRRDATLTLT